MHPAKKLPTPALPIKMQTRATLTPALPMKAQTRAALTPALPMKAQTRAALTPALPIKMQTRATLTPALPIKDADEGGSSADRISYTDTVKPEEDKSNSICATDKGNKKNACVTHAHLPSWVRPGHRRKPKEIKKKEPAFKSLSDIGPNDPAYVYIGKDNGKIRTMLPLLAVIPICVTAVALLIRRELNK